MDSQKTTVLHIICTDEVIKGVKWLEVIATTSDWNQKKAMCLGECSVGNRGRNSTRVVFRSTQNTLKYHERQLFLVIASPCAARAWVACPWCCCFSNEAVAPNLSREMHGAALLYIDPSLKTFACWSKAFRRSKTVILDKTANSTESSVAGSNERPLTAMKLAVVFEH